LCRGFHGKFYSLRTFSWQRRDLVFGGLSLLALAALLYLEWRSAGPL
jgi:energy-coupling factor transporter transmembrane protein EcfT